MEGACASWLVAIKTSISIVAAISCQLSQHRHQRPNKRPTCWSKHAIEPSSGNTMLQADLLMRMLSENDSPPSGSGSRLGTAVIVVCGTDTPVNCVLITGIFAFIATCISLFSIWLQLKNYRKPILQRYVVRILVMLLSF